MAAIASIPAVQGPFAAVPTVLSADDTITFNPQRKQLLVLHNPSGGALTVKLDGSGGSTVQIPGYGTVSVAAGLDIALTAGQTKAVVLGTVSAYCQGVVHLMGGAGIEATIFDL